MFATLLATLLPILGSALTKAIPDSAEAARVQAELQTAILNSAAEIERAGAAIVEAEAKGESWMQRNWRPLLMLTFGALIVARWLGYSAPNMSEVEVLKIWSIVELGLGGYVIGRSAEKIVPQVAAAIRR